MPATFNEHGVSFEFPENWEVEQTAVQAGQLSVTVSSPQTAFWSLSRYEGPIRPAELLAEVLATMQAEYPALEFDEADDQVAGQPMVGYDLNFFYLDLCNSASVRGYQRDGATYVIFSQAEDHELPEVAPVFRAMTTSLLRGPGDPFGE